MVVLHAIDEHDDVRIDAVPEAPSRQIFLVGSITGDTGVDDALAWQVVLQDIGEALVFLGVVAPDKGVSEDQDGRFRGASQFALPQPRLLCRVSTVCVAVNFPVEFGCRSTPSSKS